MGGKIFFIYGIKGEILRRSTKKNEEIGTQMKEKLIIRMASSLIQNDNAKICSILRGDQKSNFNLKLWGKTRNINRVDSDLVEKLCQRMCLILEKDLKRQKSSKKLKTENGEPLTCTDTPASK